ncbi:MAG TPA: hypothetical protein VGB43_08600 [Flavobacterium sp.]
MKTRSLCAAFCLVNFILLSGGCSNDSPESAETPSVPAPFNLEIGNQWIYNRYSIDVTNPSVETYTGIKDTVTAEAIVQILGVDFLKLNHSVYSYGFQDEYVRVDDFGHLIGFKDRYNGDFSNITESSLTVIHPGEDSSYENTVTNEFGSIFYHMEPQTNTTVEGNEYSILPFRGLFTPINPNEINKTVVIDYQMEVGLVRQNILTVGSNTGYEDRLVSYTSAP